MADADAAAAKLKALAVADEAAKKAPYYAKRVALFEQFKARSAAELEAARAAAAPISITLPDGSVKKGVKLVTTPLDVAAEISKGLAAAVVVAKVNDAVWDVFRPLEEDCTLKLCTFDDSEGRDVRLPAPLVRVCTPATRLSRARVRPRAQTFWHSSAHVLGEVLELTFGCDLTIGPSLEEGFYYDCFMGDRTLSEEDCKTVEKAMEKAVKARARAASRAGGSSARRLTRSPAGEASL